MRKISSIVSELSDADLVGCYGLVVKELKSRKIITNKNVTGELGEHLVINYYCNTPSLAKLQRAPTGTKNVDALSTQGDRYSIKTITAKTTGSFYDLQPKGSSLKDKQVFEFLIIAILDENFLLTKILELDWKDFIKFKSWNKRMENWNISVTQKLLSEVKVIFDSRNKE